MPEPNAAVVEPVVHPPSTTPDVPLSEQEITEQYLEKRKDGEVDNLPVPPPTIADAPPPVPPVVDETPPPPEVKAIQETDTYIEQRQERKDVKRKARGGKQVRIDERIDQLTKEAAEAKTAREEAEKKLAEAAKVVPPIEPAKAAVEPPKVADQPKTEGKPKPRMNEFTDADEYHAAMAMWAVEESARTGTIVTRESAPPTKPSVMEVRKEEFDKFLERGKKFMEVHPDFNETLQQAAIRGLTISEQARTAITRLAVPEVAYWLAKPENDLAARALMGMDDMQQVVEVGRIAERLSVSPSDFVSNAPAPGIRLTGSQVRPDLPLNQITDTDEYIRRRRQEKRNGRRR
jgi:hypothetical protein